MVKRICFEACLARLSRRKNIYVSNHCFSSFCRLVANPQFLQWFIALGLDLVSTFSVHFATDRPPGQHFRVWVLLAGAVDREGCGAPVCTPAACSRLSTEKHKGFATRSFLHVFAKLVCSSAPSYFAEWARCLRSCSVVLRMCHVHWDPDHWRGAIMARSPHIIQIALDRSRSL